MAAALSCSSRPPKRMVAKLPSRSHSGAHRSQQPSSHQFLEGEQASEQCPGPLRTLGVFQTCEASVRLTKQKCAENQSDPKVTQ